MAKGSGTQAEQFLIITYLVCAHSPESEERVANSSARVGRTTVTRLSEWEVQEG